MHGGSPHIPHDHSTPQIVVEHPSLLGATGNSPIPDFPLHFPPADPNGVLYSLEDELVQTHRFHRQANGEGARQKVIERVPGRVNFQDRNVVAQTSESFPQDLEQDVAVHRANNQRAAQSSQQMHDNFTIRDIRGTSGLRENVELQLGSFRDQAPTLSSAPSASAPGLPTNNARPNNSYQTLPQPTTAYQYTAGQLYQQTGGGIRVRSSPVTVVLT